MRARRAPSRPRGSATVSTSPRPSPSGESSSGRGCAPSTFGARRVDLDRVRQHDRPVLARHVHGRPVVPSATAIPLGWMPFQLRRTQPAPVAPSVNQRVDGIAARRRGSSRSGGRAGAGRSGCATWSFGHSQTGEKSLSTERPVDRRLLELLPLGEREGRGGGTEEREHEQRREGAGHGPDDSSFGLRWKSRRPSVEVRTRVVVGRGWPAQGPSYRASETTTEPRRAPMAYPASTATSGPADPVRGRAARARLEHLPEARVILMGLADRRDDPARDLARRLGARRPRRRARPQRDEHARRRSRMAGMPGMGARPQPPSAARAGRLRDAELRRHRARERRRARDEHAAFPAGFLPPPQAPVAHVDAGHAAPRRLDRARASTTTPGRSARPRPAR